MPRASSKGSELTIRGCAGALDAAAAGGKDLAHLAQLVRVTGNKNWDQPAASIRDFVADVPKDLGMVGRAFCCRKTFEKLRKLDVITHHGPPWAA